MNSPEPIDPGDQLIPLARVIRAHGVHGAALARVYNPDNPLGLLASPRVWLIPPTGTPQPVSLSGKLAPYGLILKIKNVTTRAAAESLKNHELAIARRHLAPLEADEYYHFDLLNLEAFLDNGQRLGRVVDLLPTAASLVLVIRDENGWENLAPFTEETIPEVDLVAGRLVVVDCPGLLQPRPTS